MAIKTRTSNKDQYNIRVLVLSMAEMDGGKSAQPLKRHTFAVNTLDGPQVFLLFLEL